jgi:hypothetical protein
MRNAIILILFVLFHCGKPDINNPSDVGNEAFWDQQEFLCLIGQTSICANSLPTPSALIVTPGNTQNTITWTGVAGAASYNLIYRTSAGVTKSNGTIISGVTSPYTHLGLTNGVVLYYVLVAKNGNFESAISQEASAMPTCSPCRMFATASQFDGAMTRSDSTVGTGSTGIAKADNWCMNDTNKPGSPTSVVFKAMLAETTSRVACTSANCTTSGSAEHINWILKDNTSYVRLDGSTVIATTNTAGIFTTQPADIMATNVNPIWVYSTGSWFNATAAQTCTNWSGVSTGCQGNSASYTGGGCGQACTANYKSVICVEQ